MSDALPDQAQPGMLQFWAREVVEIEKLNSSWAVSRYSARIKCLEHL